MNQHPVPMTRQGSVLALGRGQVQELARYKLPNFILLFNLRGERQLEGIAKAKAAGFCIKEAERLFLPSPAPTSVLPCPDPSPRPLLGVPALSAPRSASPLILPAK